MSHKFLIGVGAAFLLVFAGGIAAVVSMSSLSDVSNRPSQAAAPPSPRPAPALVSLAPEANSSLTAAPVVTPAPKPESSALVSSTDAPKLVLDSDLAKLADAVKLGKTNTGDVSKNVWAAETPVAQRLLKGMCDCDQRNWLNHFVKTGQEAVSGSEDYYQSVQVLATLRRNDQELGAAHISR